MDDVEHGHGCSNVWNMAFLPSLLLALCGTGPKRDWDDKWHVWDGQGRVLCDQFAVDMFDVPTRSIHIEQFNLCPANINVFGLSQTYSSMQMSTNCRMGLTREEITSVVQGHCPSSWGVEGHCRREEDSLGNDCWCGVASAVIHSCPWILERVWSVMRSFLLSKTIASPVEESKVIPDVNEILQSTVASAVPQTYLCIRAKVRGWQYGPEVWWDHLCCQGSLPLRLRMEGRYRSNTYSLISNCRCGVTNIAIHFYKCQWIPEWTWNVMRSPMLSRIIASAGLAQADPKVGWVEDTPWRVSAMGCWWHRHAM